MAFRVVSTILKRNFQLGSIRLLSTRDSSPIEFGNESSTRRTVTINNLKRQILAMRNQELNVTSVIQAWVKSGKEVTISELRLITRLLLKSNRDCNALEVLKWMGTQKGFQLSADDHATTLDLIFKVHGVSEAEEYFTKIKNNVARKAACVKLLHGYVKTSAIEKAEAFMAKLNGLGLLVNPHPFNEIMKLYMCTSQYEKVPLVIHQMKKNKIPLNILSYNLWMNACGELSGVTSVEMVYKETMKDKNIEIGWSTLSTLANVYVKHNCVEKALLVLKNAETKLNRSNHLGYFFLITQYASLKNKEGVLRVWRTCKAVRGRMTCANYISILSCLVKLTALEEAERIFLEWESTCRNYDIRVPNVLLGAYVRNKTMDKAESLHIRTLERGGCPNYKTWEILVEGWLGVGNMEKAIYSMDKALGMMKECEWKPSQNIVMAIAEYYEKHGYLKDGQRYVGVIHRFGVANLPLYKSLLKMHVNARKPGLDIAKMMEKDKIELDDESRALFKALGCVRD